MRVGVGILFGRFVQALKILFDEQLHAPLRPGLDAHLIAFNPLRQHLHGDHHTNSLTIEIGGDRRDMERAFQQINERAPGRELNERFDTAPVAELSDFLLRQPQAHRVSLNAKFHRPFPTLSNRSSVTAIACRLCSLRNLRSSCSNPGALCALSRSAPSTTVWTTLFKTSGGILPKNFVSSRKLRMARRDSGLSTAAVKVSTNWSPALTTPRSSSNTPRSCRSCSNSSVDRMASA